MAYTTLLGSVVKNVGTAKRDSRTKTNQYDTFNQQHTALRTPRFPLYVCIIRYHSCNRIVRPVGRQKLLAQYLDTDRQRTRVRQRMIERC